MFQILLGLTGFNCPYLGSNYTLLTSVAAKLATRIRPQTKTLSHHMPSKFKHLKNPQLGKT